MSFLNWPVSTVIDKLKELKLDKYSSAFESNDINGAVLPLLTESHMKDLGINLVGHRLKLLRFIMVLQSGGESLPGKFQSSSQSARKAQPTPAASAPPSVGVGGGSGGSSSGNYGSSYTSKAPSQPASKTTVRKVNNDYENDDYRPPSNPAASRQTAPQPKKPPPKKSYDDDDDDYTPPPPPKKSANNNMKTSLRRNAPPPPPPPDGDDDRVECAYCHRRFASDRIAKHEEVCARMSSKKKKVFDAKKQRLQGTEAAAYAKKGSSYEPQRPKPSKYKQEHQKLVEALRAARKYQAYEKAREEGRAVGPPPELPKYEIEDDDRVPCPYCGRKFGAEAAQRHISVCERMSGGGGGGRMRTSPMKRGGRR
ncbi:hypothetical protein TRFO_43228 [Tritrichomonas foetus]|uniref:Uncharacterized protein n=1 Tax=Tritrichomonas foetus TaxID=1144522 RepID=A0A1J4KRG3_9EUKA|nr:hypothetical protein TRFO_43228 [Tritrichomonas foetus]|eukprot:OHT13843.1 hypothetical protein TRFO_43228 [Tritrichomonas foetus]